MPTTAPTSRLQIAEAHLLERWGATRLAVVAMTIAMLLWPLIEGLGGAVLAAIPALELIWLRYAVHLTLLLIASRTHAGMTLLRTRYPAVQVGRSLLMLGMPVCWLMAAARMPMPTVMAIFWTTPLFAIAGAALFLHERPSLRETALVVAGTAGILLVLNPAAPPGRGGPVLALGMSGCYALYLVATRWLRREPTSVNLFHTALTVFVVLTPVMPFIWRVPPVSIWGTIVLIGALGLVLLFFVDRALHHATVAATAPLGFLQPAAEVVLFGAALGVLPSSLMRVGLLIVASVVAVCVLRRRESAAPSSERPA